MGAALAGCLPAASGQDAGCWTGVLKRLGADGEQRLAASGGSPVAPDHGNSVGGLAAPEQAQMVKLALSSDLTLLALSAEAKAGTTASGYGGDATGARPWWGGLLLAAWLAQQPADLLRGSSVVELGCGAAPLPSMAATWRGALRVLATDGCPAAVRAAAAVLARNTSAPSPCAAARQAWEEPPQHGNAKAWNVVLFADVIYSEEGADLLATAVDQHLAADGWALGAIGLLRFGSAEVFGKMSRLGFAAVELPVSPLVLERAAASAAALAGANATDLADGGNSGAMEGRCKLVRWVRRSAGPNVWDGRDEAEALERHAKDYLHVKESAVTFAEGWEPWE